MIKRIEFILEVGDDEIESPVIIIVAKISSHAAFSATVFAEANPRQQAGFRKRAIAIVVIEEILRRVIGDIEIQIAIIIVIAEGNT